MSDLEGPPDALAGFCTAPQQQWVMHPSSPHMEIWVWLSFFTEALTNTICATLETTSNCSFSWFYSNLHNRSPLTCYAEGEAAQLKGTLKVSFKMELKFPLYPQFCQPRSESKKYTCKQLYINARNNYKISSRCIIQCDSCYVPTVIPVPEELINHSNLLIRAVN